MSGRMPDVGRDRPTLSGQSWHGACASCQLEFPHVGFPPATDLQAKWRARAGCDRGRRAGELPSARNRDRSHRGAVRSMAPATRSSATLFFSGLGVRRSAPRALTSPAGLCSTPSRRASVVVFDGSMAFGLAPCHAVQVCDGETVTADGTVTRGMICDSVVRRREPRATVSGHIENASGKTAAPRKPAAHRSEHRRVQPWRQLLGPGRRVRGIVADRRAGFRSSCA